MGHESAAASHGAINLDVNQMGLSAKLRAERLAAKMSRQELADRAGVSERSIRDIENGRRPRVQEKTLLLLAEALGCDVADLGRLPEPAPVALEEQVPISRPAPVVTGQPSSPRGQVGRRLFVLALSALLLLVLGLATANFWARTHAIWEYGEDRVIVRDAILGRELWRIEQPVKIFNVVQSPWGADQLLVSFHGAAEDGAQLWLLDRGSGRRLASYFMDEAPVRAAFGDEILAEGQGFAASGVQPLDVDGDGELELAVRFTHRKWYPAAVGLYRQDGTRLGLYANRGHLGILFADDLDDDGRDELLALGTNNDPAYQAASVIYLEEGAWDGASVDPPGAPGLTADGSIQDGARYRLLLPAFSPEVMAEMNALRASAYAPTVYRDADGSVKISITVGRPDDPGVSVTLDDHLRPLSVTATDALHARVAAWPDRFREPGQFPSQVYLDRWLERARWSSRHSEAVELGTVR